MSFEKQFQPMLENYRAEWENGVWRAAMDAFELCSDNKLPIPDWLHTAVLDEMFYSCEHRREGEQWLDAAVGRTSPSTNGRPATK